MLLVFRPRIAVISGASGQFLPPIIPVIFVVFAVDLREREHYIEYLLLHIRDKSGVFQKREIEADIVAHDRLCPAQDRADRRHFVGNVRRVCDIGGRDMMNTFRLFFTFCLRRMSSKNSSFKWIFSRLVLLYLPSSKMTRGTDGSSLSLFSLGMAEKFPFASYNA